MGPGSFVRFAGIATNCPVCNGTSQIIDGLYETKADRLNVLLDPRISPEALAAIREIALKAQRGELTPAQAQRAAKKVHPKAARLFDIRHWPAQAQATLYSAITAAATALLIAKTTPAPTIVIQPPAIERVVPKDDPLTTSSISRPKIPLPRPRPTISNEGKKHPRQNRG